MKLIIAQGNPGKQYEKTRHNVGFSILDAFAAQHSSPWQDKPRFKALIAEVTIAGEKVILAKPTTYYNQTGDTARALVDFYKLDSSRDLLVIHDDLDLEFGTLRLRPRGGSAGNNGIASITSTLGETFWRLRVGINTSRRKKGNEAHYVLHKVSFGEAHLLKRTLIPSSIEIIEQFIAGEQRELTRSLETK